MSKPDGDMIEVESCDSGNESMEEEEKNYEN
jgi:hypothetical protein